MSHRHPKAAIRQRIKNALDLACRGTQPVSTQHPHYSSSNECQATFTEFETFYLIGEATSSRDSFLRIRLKFELVCSFLTWGKTLIF